MCVYGFFCNSAFEQGHLDPWRYKNALIIIIIIMKAGETFSCLFDTFILMHMVITLMKVTMIITVMTKTTWSRRRR